MLRKVGLSDCTTKLVSSRLSQRILRFGLQLELVGGLEGTRETSESPKNIDRSPKGAKAESLILRDDVLFGITGRPGIDFACLRILEDVSFVKDGFFGRELALAALLTRLSICPITFFIFSRLRARLTPDFLKLSKQRPHTSTVLTITP